MPSLKRLFDLVLATICTFLLAIPLVVIACCVVLSSPGTAIYWSDRVGKNNKIFKMPKFRTMHLGTPEVATHLLENPERYVFTVGRFLRKTSLDELPQLYSIFKGDLSFVGPRPALYNQHDLIAMRTANGVHELVPGLTGLAQIRGRDDLPVDRKVQYDTEYLRNQSFGLDLRILALTFLKVTLQDGVSH